MTTIITLTTDFGLKDEYVGVMKGIIISRAPAARIIDLTHLIPPQDIARAALLIKEAAPSFPDGTIHVLIVDPGVGSERRIILLRSQNQIFLAPDNGILTLVTNEESRAHLVSNHNLFLKKISNTFHGRDIFAPVAAALANGLRFTEVGPEIANKKLVELPWPRAAIDKNKIRGRVVCIDHFGNLITNIHYDLLPEHFVHHLSGLSVEIKGNLIKKISSCYRQGGEAQLAALFNSGNYLEISRKNASAARFLNSNGREEVSIILSR